MYIATVLQFVNAFLLAKKWHDFVQALQEKCSGTTLPARSAFYTKYMNNEKFSEYCVCYFVVVVACHDSYLYSLFILLNLTFPYLIPMWQNLSVVLQLLMHLGKEIPHKL